jgi:hypothetical protein
MAKSISADDLEMIVTVLTGNAAGMEMVQTDDLVALEGTEGFKDLTDCTLGKIIADLKEYTNCLKQVEQDKRNPPNNAEFNSALNQALGFNFM